MSIKIAVFRSDKTVVAQSAGFEPAWAEPNRFLVCRLNHSATTAMCQTLSMLKILG